MNRLCEPRFSCRRAWKSAMKCSGMSCTSTSKPTSPFDAEAGGAGVERRAGAELHRVGRDREVGLADQPRVVAGAQRDRDALERRAVGRRREARVEPADRQDEARPAAEAGAQRRGSGDGKLVGEPRVHQHGVDRGRAVVEVDDAHRLEVEADEIVVGRRQLRADAAEREQPLCATRTPGSAPGPSGSATASASRSWRGCPSR